MKRIYALAISASLCMLLMGCSGNAEPAVVDTNPDAEVSTETQDGLVPDDTGGEEYIPEETETNLCLMGGEYLFKDYTYVTNTYDESDGSYYDEYLSEDGSESIYEKGVPGYNTDIALEDYMLEEAEKLAGNSGVVNATLEESSYGTDLSGSAYVAKFYSGLDDDMRSWMVYVVDSGKGLLMYGLSCPLDYEDSMVYDAEDVFPKLTIESNYRGYYDESEFSETIDLMTFLGNPIDDALVQISGLVEDGEQYSAKEEKSSDGISLAGPFIDVDADGTVTGITYSGETYSVGTLWVGISMEYSGADLKDLGWEFQSVDFAHGTAQYVVTYTKDDMEMILVSDESGDFDKSEESDVTGCIATITVQKK